ncbi:M6 family metalloprotease domain-containing protein [Streptomyces agglomeratus]|uniref:M6 family metalloprotease domain-containing protein n=1 Tax=Streptomyces agglomeratus TaxID=285458 RepID=UPI00085457D4|nr:M6 family metalloprotease domain-containing protein [Streptomyces agglomeratus]OEJ39495.1 M6 family metalloprotease domain-containing protein [Streptomyces agglomeratus]OEJ46121.1 M6 family metalloprotease domain-containing protein [Streptomyces agglomeratus]
MQQTRPRIRKPRHIVSVAVLTGLALTSVTSAGSPLNNGSEASAGPVGAGDQAVSVVDEAALRPCRITGTMGVQMSEGLPTPPGFARSTGEVRALTLMIDFSDAPGKGPARDRFEEFFPQTTKWFTTSSYGRLRYRPVTPFTDWVRMPLPFAAYGIDRGSPYEPGYRSLVQDIIAETDDRVNFRAYDLVNILVTPNAGPSALDTVLSVTFSGNDDAPRADGVPLANTSFVYSRQDDGSGSYGETGFRVLPHENGHVFGLPDLYTVDGGGTVGHWDIMSEDWGANNDLLGWHKWKLGWLDSAQIRCASERGTTEHLLAPLASRDGHEGRAKLVFVPLTETTGYAVEVRTRAGNDDAVCKPGVLVYRVDADVDTGNGPVTVADSERDSGGCTRQPNVHAELSDAPFEEGETFRDRQHGVRIAVTDEDERGNFRVRVTRR